MIKYLARGVLRIFGWKIDKYVPVEEKFVLVGAPHTSNWDFTVGLLGVLSLGVRFKWVAKDSIFTGPPGFILKKFGGIPVDRSVRNTFTNKMVELFNNRKQLILGIMPEGTRSKTNYWKTGFYYIAMGAKVPIALAYMDYRQKRAGVGLLFHPSGNINFDMERIKEFYKDKFGKHPEKQSEIKIRDRNKE